MVEAFDNIYKWKRPSIAKVFPYKQTHVICSSNEGLWGWSIWKCLFIYCRFSYPLHARYFLKMPEGVTHNCLRWTANWSINHHKWRIWVLNHYVSHVNCCLHKRHRRANLKKWKLIILLSQILFFIFSKEWISRYPFIDGFAKSWRII